VGEEGHGPLIQTLSGLNQRSAEILGAWGETLSDPSAIPFPAKERDALAGLAAEVQAALDASAPAAVRPWLQALAFPVYYHLQARAVMLLCAALPSMQPPHSPRRPPLRRISRPLPSHLPPSRQGCYELTTDASVRDDPSVLRALRAIAEAAGPCSELHLHFAFKTLAAELAAGAGSPAAAEAKAAADAVFAARYGGVAGTLSPAASARLMAVATQLGADKRAQLCFPL